MLFSLDTSLNNQNCMFCQIVLADLLLKFQIYFFLSQIILNEKYY